MNSGWTFDYTHNQDAWYAAEFVYFDMNGQQDVFDAGTAVVLLDCVADDGFSPLEEKHGTYHNLLHRTVGVDVNTDFQTLGFSYNNSLGENCAWFPEYDTVIPYNPPEPFDDFCGIICWNGIAKYGTQPPMGDFTYWPNWIEHTPPPS